jgi:hypothetical protein
MRRAHWGHVALLPALTAAQWQRLMNNSNFHSHNIANEGCAPVVTSKFTTPVLCQAACDSLGACDMWT